MNARDSIGPPCAANRPTIRAPARRAGWRGSWTPPAIAPSARVLDDGCGLGLYLERLASGRTRCAGRRVRRRARPAGRTAWATRDAGRRRAAAVPRRRLRSDPLARSARARRRRPPGHAGSRPPAGARRSGGGLRPRFAATRSRPTASTGAAATASATSRWSTTCRLAGAATGWRRTSTPTPRDPGPAWHPDWRLPLRLVRTAVLLRSLRQHHRPLAAPRRGAAGESCRRWSNAAAAPSGFHTPGWWRRKASRRDTWLRHVSRRGCPSGSPSPAAPGRQQARP